MSNSENPNTIVVEGGYVMDPELFWSLFMETGAPELYLLYHKAVQGVYHVLEDGGTDPSGNRV